MGVFAVGPAQTGYKAAANLPQTGQLALFAVVGTVRARFWSRVSTVLGASGGSVTKYVFTPTVGATSSNLSTAADLGTAAAGTFVFTFTTGATTMSSGAGAAISSGGARPSVGIVGGLWFQAGTLYLDCSGNQTGQMEHWILWTPMAPDSYVYPL